MCFGQCRAVISVILFLIIYTLAHEFWSEEDNINEYRIIIGDLMSGVCLLRIIWFCCEYEIQTGLFCEMEKKNK